MTQHRGIRTGPSGATAVRIATAFADDGAPSLVAHGSARSFRSTHEGHLPPVCERHRGSPLGRPRTHGGRGCARVAVGVLSAAQRTSSVLLRGATGHGTERENAPSSFAQRHTIGVIASARPQAEDRLQGVHDVGLRPVVDLIVPGHHAVAGLASRVASWPHPRTPPAVCRPEEAVVLAGTPGWRSAGSRTSNIAPPEGRFDAVTAPWSLTVSTTPSSTTPSAMRTTRQATSGEARSRRGCAPPVRSSPHRPTRRWARDPDRRRDLAEHRQHGQTIGVRRRPAGDGASLPIRQLIIESLQGLGEAGNRVQRRVQLVRGSPEPSAGFPSTRPYRHDPTEPRR